jgi:PhzF family phenazine biosynthesis protein
MGLARVPEETATVWQQCAVGEVELKVLRLSAGGVKVFVKTPAPGSVAPLTTDEARAVAAAIGLADAADAYRVSAGANWVVVKLDEPAGLAMLKPTMPAIEALSITLGVSGITAYAPAVDCADVRFDVRSFGPAIGVPEDAVCGGGNACVATLQHHLQGLRVDAGYLAYQTRQGRFVGRDGRVHIRGPVEDHRFWIGGTTRTMMTGKVSL